MAAIVADTRLEPQRYFEEIDSRTERVLVVAADHLDVAVPDCPGWVVGDVVEHLSRVYEHKVRVMADNAWPAPWPPEDDTFVGDPLDVLADAKAHLFEEFARHAIDEETTTFAAFDQTIGFWARRMALEVAIHGHDVDAAVGRESTVPDDLALDGIDEILTVMLAGPWWDGRVDTEHPIDAVVAVDAGGLRWLVTCSAKAVLVGPTSTQPALTIAADPADLFRWLWGRASGDVLTVTGDAALLTALRGRIIECTG